MLLHGARADAELAGDLLVAAPLHEQSQYLLVPGRNLYFIEVNHGRFVCSLWVCHGVATRWKQVHAVRQIFAGSQLVVTITS